MVIAIAAFSTCTHTISSLNIPSAQNFYTKHMLEEVMKYGWLNAANVVFLRHMAQTCVSLFVLEYTLC